MKRYLMDNLKTWQTSPTRKPLILRGARQVGKTWLLKEFGKSSFENIAYVRLEDNEPMKRLFEGSLDPRRLLRGIAAETGEQIDPNTTLIILDEVQAVPQALTALKYFCEDTPEFSVIAAGSLLGATLNAGISFPVGKVNFMDLYPLNFREFLLAMGEETLEKDISEADFSMIDVFKERYEDLLRLYYYVGGMPEAVKQFAQNNNFTEVRQIQNDIIDAYQGDFAKHTSPLIGERCRMIFESLPRHLAKENKKFLYGTVKKGARGRDLDDALRFLVDSGIVMKVKRVSAPGLPLDAYVEDSAFKLFCVDIGLLGALANIDSETIIAGDTLFTHFKGALAEQYVCQQLVSDNDIAPYYWSATNSAGEIDFVVQINREVIPIEVKAEENLKSKSLAAFCKRYDLHNAVRLSLSGYRHESWLTNIPLYAIHCIG